LYSEFPFIYSSTENSNFITKRKKKKQGKKTKTVEVTKTALASMNKQTIASPNSSIQQKKRKENVP
jgi:hypothetical protein